MVHSELPPVGSPGSGDGAPTSLVRGRQLRWLFLLFGLGLLTVSGAACAKARAETVPEGPPLATPAPPPRMLAPVEEVLAEAPPPPETPPQSPPDDEVEASPAPRRPAPVADAQKPSDSPPAQPAVANAADSPVRTPAINPAEERKVREILRQAEADLGRVDYGKLSADGKLQYDQSKRFSALADQALQDRHYLLAATHAGKAQDIARQLVQQ